MTFHLRTGVPAVPGVMAGSPTAGTPPGAVTASPAAAPPSLSDLHETTGTYEISVVKQGETGTLRL